MVPTPSLRSCCNGKTERIWLADGVTGFQGLVIGGGSCDRVKEGRTTCPSSGERDMEDG